MAVATTENKTWLYANGINVEFDFHYVCTNTDQIEIYFRDLAGNEEEQTSGFVVTLNPTENGGLVTFSIAPSLGYHVGILRILPETHEVRYKYLSEMRSEVIEFDFDDMIMIDQQQSTKLGECLKIPSSDLSTTILPNSIERAGMFFTFDADGNPLMVADSAGGYPVTPFMAIVLDDADALTARATLGLTIDSDVQAYDAQLAAVASYTGFIADDMILFTDSATTSGVPSESYGRSLLNTESASGARNVLEAVNKDEDNIWSETQLYNDNSLICTSGTTTWDMDTYQNTYLLLDQDTTLSGIINSTDTGYFTCLVENGGAYTLSFDSMFLTTESEGLENTVVSGSVDLLNVYVHNGKAYSSISTNFG